MYPLNMTSPDGGFAVANDASEHQTLSDAGYEPKLVVEAPVKFGKEDRG